MSLSAEQILEITSPEALFISTDMMTKVHQELVRAWHPDFCKAAEAERVFGHISRLWAEAKRLVEIGEWHNHGFSSLKGEDNKTREIRWRRRAKTRLCTTIYGPNILAHVYNPEYVGLARLFQPSMERLRLTAEESSEYAKFFPNVVDFFTTADKAVVVVKKTSDIVSLKSLGTPIDPRHVAWIINRLYSLACLFHKHKTAFLGFAPEYLWVSPKNHALYLYNGWPFSLPLGKEIKIIPAFVQKVVSGKTADANTDVASIKEIGRSLLGDGLRSFPRIHAALSSLPTGDPPTDWRNWEAALLETFGPKKFVVYPFDETKFWADGPKDE